MKNNNNYLLPVGSVVKFYDEFILIVSRCTIFNNGNQYSDYIGTKFPVEIILDNLIRFNHEDIEQILHLGLDNEDNIKQTMQLKIWLDENVNVEKVKELKGNIWKIQNILMNSYRKVLENLKMIRLL
ncbi:MAG: DUF4176 domain-containing protein [Mycoplasmatales bacterium]